MTTLVSRSRQCRLENERLVESSRTLIAISRRALNPAWGMSGASDSDIREYPSAADLWTLRLAIRQRLQRKTLFPAPSMVWAGPGTGRVCVVCNVSISAADMETEMILGPVTIWAHWICYMVWREESWLVDDGDRAQSGMSQSSRWEERP